MDLLGLVQWDGEDLKGSLGMDQWEEGAMECLVDQWAEEEEG